MKKEELYYFHAVLNRLYFLNELEPVIIRVSGESDYEIDDDESMMANFVSMTDPFLIWFNSELLSDDDEVYIITVLMHEMVHQYCAQWEIEDMLPEGSHSEAFKEAAADHGLTQGGYVLSSELKGFIEEKITSYHALNDMSPHFGF